MADRLTRVNNRLSVLRAHLEGATSELFSAQKLIVREHKDPPSASADHRQLLEYEQHRALELRTAFSHLRAHIDDTSQNLAELVPELDALARALPTNARKIFIDGQGFISEFHHCAQLLSRIRDDLANIHVPEYIHYDDQQRLDEVWLQLADAETQVLKLISERSDALRVYLGGDAFLREYNTPITVELNIAGRFRSLDSSAIYVLDADFLWLVYTHETSGLDADTRKKIEWNFGFPPDTIIFPKVLQELSRLKGFSRLVDKRFLHALKQQARTSSYTPSQESLMRALKLWLSTTKGKRLAPQVGERRKFLQGADVVILAYVLDVGSKHVVVLSNNTSDFKETIAMLNASWHCTAELKTPSDLGFLTRLSAHSQRVLLAPGVHFQFQICVFAIH